jgi:hypothetical protein
VSAGGLRPGATGRSANQCHARPGRTARNPGHKLKSLLAGPRAMRRKSGGAYAWEIPVGARAFSNVRAPSALSTPKT